MMQGMGNCCLQLTYETTSINHARYLHDALIPFTPILSALSQASPIFKGKLSDWDFRFNTISMAVDDRTEKERDPKSDHFVKKSRYSASSYYLSNHQFVKESYNSYNPVEQKHLKTLLQAGLD